MKQRTQELTPEFTNPSNTEKEIYNSFKELGYQELHAALEANCLRHDTESHTWGPEDMQYAELEHEMISILIEEAREFNES